MTVVRGPLSDDRPVDVPAAPRADASPPAAEEHDEALVRRGSHIAECAAWSLVWLAVLTAGVSVWSFWWSSPLVGALAPLMVLAGIAGTVATFAARSPRSPLLQRLAFCAVVVAVVFPQAVMIHTRVFATTDASAFDQAAARDLLHGRDPYTVSLSGAAHLLSVPARFWTYTADGGHVTHVSYPAGSFLVDVPSMALGMRHMVVDWTDLAAWVLCVALFFLLLPVSLRWLAGLLAMTPIFLGMFSAGGTDAVFLPLLLLAVWRWDRFADPTERGPARWIGPLALGLACAMKQEPWFCVPFLVTGVAMEARRAGRPPLATAARYAATVAGVFLAVNLPFVVWHPAAWARGTMLPLVGGLVADGQGLVSLATHGVSGGADLGMLAVAGALAYLALLGAWLRWYPVCKRVWLLALPVTFFFSPRSLSSYLVDLFPLAVIAAVSVRGAATRPAASGSRGRIGMATAVVPAVGVILACALAFASHPLRIGVDAAETTAGGRQLAAVTVTVRNLTGATVTPHFMVNPGAGTSGFWQPSTGRPLVLGPGRIATVTLRAPVSVPAPQHGARWLVEAYTTGPDALTTSPLLVWHGR